MRDADITRKHKNLVYVQALKFLQTRATPRRRGAPARRGGEAAAAGVGQRRARIAARQELMHRQGQDDALVKSPGAMPATDDEIREKYLERAIRELNQLTRELQECPHCPRGKLMPVLGSGHPQADVMMLKHSPLPSEIEEGVAFYGRAGNALMK